MKKNLFKLFIILFVFILFSNNIYAADSIACQYSDNSGNVTVTWTYNRTANSVSVKYGKTEYMNKHSFSPSSAAKQKQQFVDKNSLLTCPYMNCNVKSNGKLVLEFVSKDELDTSSSNYCNLSGTGTSTSDIKATTYSEFEKNQQTQTDNLDNKQIVCKYGNTKDNPTVTVTYNSVQNTVKFAYGKDNYGMSYYASSISPANISNDEDEQSIYFKNGDKLTCPYMACGIDSSSAGAGGDTGGLVIKFSTINQNGLCKLLSSGSTEDNQEDTSYDKKEEEESELFNGGFGLMDLGGDMTCVEMLGSSLAGLLKTARIALQVAACIIAIVKGMLTFVPAITSKNPDSLSKALSSFATMLVVLAVIMLLPTLVRTIGNLVGFDISCI